MRSLRPLFVFILVLFATSSWTEARTFKTSIHHLNCPHVCCEVWKEGVPIDDTEKGCKRGCDENCRDNFFGGKLKSCLPFC